MSTAAAVFINLSDLGVVSASSWIASAPPILLQNRHVSRRYKGRLGDTEYVILDLLSPQEFDSIALLGCTSLRNSVESAMGDTVVSQVRASTVDALGEAGDAYDSGSAAGRLSVSTGGNLVVHLDEPITARYVRIDLFDDSAEALLAGRLVVGLRHAFSINFAYGWGYGYTDLSRLKKSVGGQTFVDVDDRFRVLSLAFEIVTDADRYGFIDDMDRLNGISTDILFVINPESTNPARDTIWGLMKDLSLPTQPYPDLFSKTYVIEERL